ncbi:MAG TPA: trypsin-like serine protease [Polyangia bacterium]|jgi:secreted trypsin-like serine protease
MRHRSSSLAVLGLVAAAALGACTMGNKDAPQFTLTRRPIINGTVDTAHPSVVALVYQGEQFCTGTVIAPRAILSAGHCLVEMASQTPGFRAADCTIFFGTTVGGSGQELAVTTAHAHPQYGVRNDGAPINDVSVWNLAEDAPAPAMAWQQTAMGDITGETVTLVGYGVTNASSQTGNGTRRVTTNPVSSVDSMFIYYGDGHSGTCQGDSGGPAFLGSAGSEVLVGVCSFGDSTCVQEGANTRVDTYAAFIQQYAGTSTTIAPVNVAITAPADGSTQGAAFTVTATVASTAGVSKAELLLDGAVKKTLSAAPWSFALSNVAAGSHQLKVRGTGADGGTGSATITVTVQTAPAGCSAANPCQAGYDCVGGTCVAQTPSGCSAANPCQAGYDCVNGTCVAHTPAGCSAANPCQAGYDCVSGTCVAQTPSGCSAANPCQHGFDCIIGQCVVHVSTTCGAASECPAGYECSGGQCVATTPSVGTTGSVCDQNSDCESSLCVLGETPQGYCTQVCAQNSDCPHDAACHEIDGTKVCGAPSSAVVPPTGDAGGGGCQTGGAPGGAAGGLALLLAALGLAVRRR